MPGTVATRRGCAAAGRRGGCANERGREAKRRARSTGGSRGGSGRRIHDGAPLRRGWIERRQRRVAAADGVRGLRDDGVHRRAGRARARAPRIAVHAVAPAALRRQPSVRTSCRVSASMSDVSASPACEPISSSAKPLLAQSHRVKPGVGDAIVLADGVRARRSLRPTRGRGARPPPGCPSGSRHESPRNTMSRKPCAPEAARGRLEDAAIRIRGNRDRPRIAHVAVGGLDAALGHVGDDRRHERVAERAGDPLREQRDTRALCLPSAMWGPFCSVPPIGTRIVVLPARMRAASSGEVRSSRSTDAGAAADPAEAMTSEDPCARAPRASIACARILRERASHGLRHCLQQRACATPAALEVSRREPRFAAIMRVCAVRPDQRRVAPHCRVVNLVRSGRKQPQRTPASAGITARHLFRLRCRGPLVPSRHCRCARARALPERNAPEPSGMPPAPRSPHAPVAPRAAPSPPR